MFCNCLKYYREKSNEKVVEQVKDTKAIIYRDELTKKVTSVKKSVRFADAEDVVLGEFKDDTIRRKDDISEEKMLLRSATGIELGERERIRVKVKMTKEEAVRLLSKCKEGGVLEFNDVARQLAALPVDRVTVFS